MITFNNKILRATGKWLTKVDPLNPLGLPANTIRCKFQSGYTPTMGDTQTLVDSTNNVWDIYKESNDWGYVFEGNSKLLEVLGANTTGVTNMQFAFLLCSSLTSVPLFDTSNVTVMSGMFNSCSSLTSAPLFDTSNVIRMGGMFYNCANLTTVPLFDTSNVTDMSDMFNACTNLTSVPLFDTSNVTSVYYMFYNCTNLTSVPLFDTSSVTNMSRAFYNCYNVQSGALALYQQASTQTNPPTSHYYTFYDCGRDTQTGAAELAQIPNDWK